MSTHTMPVSGPSPHLTFLAALIRVLITVHTLTQGALAARLVMLLPWTMDAVVTVTNPKRAIVFVAGTAAAAMAVGLAQLIRHNRRTRPQPATAAGDHEGSGQQPGAAPDPASSTDNDADAAAVLTDLAKIAATVTVQIAPDGSITVSGIPANVPPDLGLVVAEIATEAALKQLARIIPLRPNPNRDDRRLLTKAARDAIKAEAAQRARQAA